MNINSKQLNENVYQSRGDYEGHKKKKKKVKHNCSSTCFSNSR